MLWKWTITLNYTSDICIKFFRHVHQYLCLFPKELFTKPRLRQSCKKCCRYDINCQIIMVWNTFINNWLCKINMLDNKCEKPLYLILYWGKNGPIMKYKSYQIFICIMLCRFTRRKQNLAHFLEWSVQCLCHPVVWGIS